MRIDTIHVWHGDIADNQIGLHALSGLDGFNAWNGREKHRTRLD